MIQGALDNYINDISPYEAFADEILQNFLDSAKEYIIECKKNDKIPEESILEIIPNKEKSEIVIKQSGTTGIVHREEYIKYSATSKLKNSKSAGSRGIGWKIWMLICNIVETETFVENQYYQTKHILNHQEKKLTYEEWVNKPHYFKQSVWNNGRTIIRFKTIENKKGYADDETDYFSEINTSWKRVMQERYFLIFEKYPSIKVYLVSNDEKKLINPKKKPSKYEEIEEIRKKEVEILPGKYAKNILISYTLDNELIPKNRDGIAIIIKDRVIEWYRPNIIHNIGISGKFFGYIECDYLYRMDNTSHDSLQRKHKEVKKTYEFVRIYVRQLIEEIQTLDLSTSFIPNKPLALMRNFNEILSNLIKTPSSFDVGQGLSNENNTIFSDSNEKKEQKIKLESFQIKPNHVDLKRSNQYSAEFTIINQYIARRKIIGRIKIRSYQKDEELVLKSGKNICKIDFEIPDYLKAGGCLVKLSLLGQDKIYQIDSKQIHRSIEPIIENFKLDNTRYLLGNSIFMTYIVNFKYISEPARILLELIDPNKKQVYRKEYTITKKQKRDKFRQRIYLQKDYDRGKYFLSLKVFNKKDGKILQIEKKRISVQEYLYKFEVEKQYFDFNEKIQCKCIFYNPTNRKIENGSLSIIIYNLKGIEKELARRKVYLFPNKKFEIEKRFSFSNKEYNSGKYYLRVKFNVSGESTVEEKVKTLYLDQEMDEQEPEGGFFNNIDYSKNLAGRDDPMLATRDLDGNILINTFHYLFSKIDNDEGFHLDRFKEMIIYAMWDALQEQINEDNHFSYYWQFERYLRLKGV